MAHSSAFAASAFCPKTSPAKLTKLAIGFATSCKNPAALAQLVEQLPRKEQVSSSILLGGSQFLTCNYVPEQPIRGLAS